MMMRNRWTEVSLDHYDFLEARVAAMSSHIEELENRLRSAKSELEIMKGFTEEADEQIIRNDEYPMPSLFLSTLPMQNQVRIEWN